MCWFLVLLAAEIVRHMSYDYWSWGSAVSRNTVHNIHIGLCQQLNVA